MESAQQKFKIVTIGGGTGMSVLLSSLRRPDAEITALVAVTDDGGSSGRLRRDLGILPPGDIRNCLIALSAPESDLDKVMNYYFPPESDLCGHNLGNLIMAGLVHLHDGDFAAAVRHASKLLSLEGHVLPVTADNVTLLARMEDGSLVGGETSIVADERKISHIFLEPPTCRPLPEVLQALREADYILLGPGSLYTSIITNLLVPGIVETIIESKAPVYYVCNIATQKGEMEKPDVAAHIEAIATHTVPGLINYVIVNNASFSDGARAYLAANGSQPVEVPDERMLAAMNIQLIACDLVNEPYHLLWRHNETKLRALWRKLFF